MSSPFKAQTNMKQDTKVSSLMMSTKIVVAIVCITCYIEQFVAALYCIHTLLCLSTTMSSYLTAANTRTGHRTSTYSYIMIDNNMTQSIKCPFSRHQFSNSTMNHLPFIQTNTLRAGFRKVVIFNYTLVHHTFSKVTA